jgi:hypothetical protein
MPQIRPDFSSTGRPGSWPGRGQCDFRLSPPALRADKDASRGRGQAVPVSPHTDGGRAGVAMHYVESEPFPVIRPMMPAMPGLEVHEMLSPRSGNLLTRPPNEAS